MAIRVLYETRPLKVRLQLLPLNGTCGQNPRQRATVNTHTVYLVVQRMSSPADRIMPNIARSKEYQIGD